jgi:hypothetical protein
VASLGSVTTGWSKWGMSLYTESSILLGSIIKILTISGESLKRMLLIMAFNETLFPVPVAPATRRWGIFTRSVMTGAPVISIPRAMGSPWLVSLKSWDDSTSLRWT